jgi:hypothetical protein
MKNKIITTAIAILLIGIISAGLIDYFGEITGTVEVSGPVFYVASGGDLLTNSDSPAGPNNQINNNNFKIWETDSLGDIVFSYTPQIDFYVRTSVDTPSENLNLIFGYDDGDEKELCSKNITIDSLTLSNYGPFTCSSDIIPEKIDTFYYKIKGNCTSCEYKISGGAGDFYTKVEVSKS